MTDRERQRLNRRQLQELCLRQEKSCEAAKRRLEDLEQENRTLRDSLTRIGKTMKDMRAREEAAEAALAEKDGALRDMEQKLAAAEAAQTDRGHLGEQVDLLFDNFRQLRSVLQEKDRQLQTAEHRIAEQEQTIQRLQRRLGSGD